MLTRDTLLAALQAALEPMPVVNAMWQGGAAAFDRVDQWSDIDLQVDVQDGHVPEVVAAVERTLAELSPVELKYEVPQPSWHGHYQAFYRLRDAGPFLLVDFVAIEHSNPNKFLQSAIHGTPVVAFDKAGVVRSEELDMTAHHETLRRRVASLRITFPLFQPLVEKEIARANYAEAVSFYHGLTLRPLVELLRIQHSPARYNFHARYLYYDFPRSIAERLERLFFIADGEDLKAKHREAGEWFREEELRAER